MKYLLLTIPLIAMAFCPSNKEFIDCKTSPCVEVTDNQIGVKVVATCSKVYRKENGEWVFDYFSLVNIVQTTGKTSTVMSFESRVYDLTKKR